MKVHGGARQKIEYPRNVVPVKFCSLVVQRVVWIWLIEKVNESINYCIDVKYRFPILTENIQANIPFEIDVRVVNICLAVNLTK